MELRWLITGLLLALPVPAQEWPQGWQACRDEAAPLVRLACYDALGQAEAGTATPLSAAESRSANWQAIWQQEQGRTQDSPPFLPAQDELDEALWLTRPALRGATLAIGCAHHITTLRVRLDAPWQGDEVQMQLDGRPVLGNWFVRERGWLLEYGRGLPAIALLQTWQQPGQLTLIDGQGSRLQFPLGGLQQALLPLRALCRW